MAVKPGGYELAWVRGDGADVGKKIVRVACDCWDGYGLSRRVWDSVALGEQMQECRSLKIGDGLRKSN